MVDFVLNATTRSDMGKGASRRLRRLEQLVPAIVYGGTTAPESITLSDKELSHALANEAFYSHIIGLSLNGKVQDVILKDLQRHPVKSTILHADFLRLDKTQTFTTKVPLHFINEETCHGVKVDGGQIAHSMNDLEIECLPGNLPEYLEVDMLDVSLGQILHISDIKLPEGVVSVALQHGAEHDLPIASVNKSKAVSEDDADTDTDTDTAEPEDNDA